MEIPQLVQINSEEYVNLAHVTSVRISGDELTVRLVGDEVDYLVAAEFVPSFQAALGIAKKPGAAGSR